MSSAAGSGRRRLWAVHVRYRVEQRRRLWAAHVRYRVEQRRRLWAPQALGGAR